MMLFESKLFTIIVFSIIVFIAVVLFFDDTDPPDISMWRDD